MIVSFLGMARQLSQTIGQASMQVAMIARVLRALPVCSR